MAKGSAASSRNLVAARVVYGAAWLACLALYWGGLATGALGGGGIMGYTLLALYVVLPAAGLVLLWALHQSDVWPLEYARINQHR